MATSKQEVEQSIFDKVCADIEIALKSRTTKDEVTYCSVEGLSGSEIYKIQKMYQDLGWTVEYEECAGEYEDLWFS